MDIVERREFKFRTPNNLELTICDEETANWLQGMLDEIERLRLELEACQHQVDTVFERAERAEAERDKARKDLWDAGISASEMILELTRERDALRRQISEHNEGCQSACMARTGPHNCGYKRDSDNLPKYEGRRCPECPLGYIIDAARELNKPK